MYEIGIGLNFDLNCILIVILSILKEIESIVFEYIIRLLVK